MTAPSMAKWAAASLLLSLAYWIILVRIDAGAIVDVLDPQFTADWLRTALLANAPVLGSLLLAILFRLAERSVWSWVLLVIAAKVTAAFALFIALYFGDLLFRI
ncbi:MAG TPA: hypothetical protein VGG48_17925 [Rhizomicrobium sp.]|jgi:hypothetical protein